MPVLVGRVLLVQVAQMVVLAPVERLEVVVKGPKVMLLEVALLTSRVGVEVG
jgi:hypothetical protein